MIRKTLVLTLLGIALYAKTIDGIAILVKDEPITLSDLRKGLSENGNNLQRTVDVLIRKSLEEQEAKTRGITVTSAEVHADLEKIAEQNGITLQALYDNAYSTQQLTQSQLKEQIEQKLLNQKLYSAIAFEHMEEPTELEISEYYQVHQSEFSHAQRFDVIVYQSASKERLEEKVNNPMRYLPDVSSSNQTFEFAAINPKLAMLLQNSPLNSFTPVIPMQSGYVSFFVQEKRDIVTQELESVRPQIRNAIMGEKREQILDDYFARLRLNADIKIIRMPE